MLTVLTSGNSHSLKETWAVTAPATGSRTMRTRRPQSEIYENRRRGGRDLNANSKGPPTQDEGATIVLPQTEIARARDNVQYFAKSVVTPY